MENKLAIAICAIGVIVATLTTCVAANVVAPANGWSNIAPKKISFRKGVVITIVISIVVMQPWFIYGSGAAYIFTWLNNYGTIIAPVAAILCADYFTCKEKRVDVASLYLGSEGRYRYSNGWNWSAIIAWLCSFIIPILGNTALSYKAGSGLTPNFIQYIAANGYIFSFAVAYIVYVILMRSNAFGTPAQKGFVTKEEDEAMTIVEK